MKKWTRLFLVCVVSLLLAGCGMSVPEREMPEGYSGGSVGLSKDEKNASLAAELSGEGTDTSLSAELQEEEGDASSEMESSAKEAAENVGDAEREPNSAEPAEEGAGAGAEGVEGETLPEEGVYTSKDDVALYIHLYGHLPSNFLTKKEAEAMGWEGGSLEPYAPGMCIGGSRFGNYEGLLPEKEGRFYTECDIDTLGEDKRGVKRIVFSNDGLVYYTEDHYESFELLYGEE